MAMINTLGFIFLVLVLTTCQNCEMGSYLDGSQCKACDFRCAVCSAANICTVCQNQAYLTIIEGGLICKLCNEIMSGCAICQSQNSCSVCLEGFTLGSTGCLPSNQAGGQISLQNEVTCQSFQINLNGVCHPSIALCQQYTSAGACSQCSEDSLLIQGYCIPAHIAQNANSGNPTQSNPDTNLNCSPRQYIENGACVAIGEECQQFLANGSCTKCRIGFLVYNGLCLQEPNDSHDKTVVSYIPKSGDQPQKPNLQSDSHQEPTLPQASSSTSKQSSCQSPCETCTEDPSHCLTCEAGFTTVDDIIGCFRL